METVISLEPQHSVCLGAEQEGPSSLSWLAHSVPVPSCWPSTAPWATGQGSDQAEVLLGHISWPFLLSRQGSFPTLPAPWLQKELNLQEAGILREAGILSSAFSFRTRLNQKKPPSVKATDRQDPSAAPDYLLFSKTCFLRKLLLK